MNVVFFVEDTYGPIFLENLLRFLRKESLIPECIFRCMIATYSDS